MSLYKEENGDKAVVTCDSRTPREYIYPGNLTIDGEANLGNQSQTSIHTNGITYLLIQ
jgi:hypothetical protein